MKKNFSGCYLAKLICLLIVAGILYLSWGQTAYAVEDNRPDTVTDTPYRDSNLTGTESERTNVDPPGASESAEDLAELNIANTVTVTYNNGNGSVNGALRILLILTLIAIAPSLIIMLTSFTRIIIVLHFTRQALNTQTAPPNTVLIGIALFLTFYVMQPTMTAIYTDAIVPFEAGEMTQEEALTAAAAPIRQFMYRQTQVNWTTYRSVCWCPRLLSMSCGRRLLSVSSYIFHLL